MRETVWMIMQKVFSFGGDPSRRRTLASIHIRHSIGGQMSW